MHAQSHLLICFSWCWRFIIQIWHWRVFKSLLCGSPPHQRWTADLDLLHAKQLIQAHWQNGENTGKLIDFRALGGFLLLYPLRSCRILPKSHECGFIFLFFLLFVFSWCGLTWRGKGWQRVQQWLLEWRTHLSEKSRQQIYSNWLVDQEQKSTEDSCTMKSGKRDPVLKSRITVKTSQVLLKSFVPRWSGSPDLLFCRAVPEADVEELWNSSDRSEGQQNKTHVDWALEQMNSEPTPILS